MATHSNGMSARQLEDQLGVTYRRHGCGGEARRRGTIPTATSRRRRRDRTDAIPFCAGDALIEPGAAGKSLVAGAVEGSIAAPAGQAEAQGREVSRQRSGRLRLAMIADSAAKSIEAFVRANVKPGATQITTAIAAYPGSRANRQDRACGSMAARIILP